LQRAVGNQAVRRLLQSNTLSHPLVQRACRSGSICTNIKGDPVDFDAKAQAAVQALIDPPVNC
jgi:hypothetical protein